MFVHLHLFTVSTKVGQLLKKRDSYPGHVPSNGNGAGEDASGPAGSQSASGAAAMGRGVLRAGLAAERFQLARRLPSASLAPFVDYYWIVRWDLRGQPPHEQTILPHPNVNLAFEASGAGIFGVDRSLFTRQLSGRGQALGVRFRPGCFRPFWQAPISQLSDRVVPAVLVFGPLAEKTRREIICADSDADMTAHAESLLYSALPDRDPVAEQAADLVALITSSPSLRRVDELSAASGWSVRSLQRLFADYVGVSPKWVMRRARLHEAAERADSGEVVDWGALAFDLGYADQAHLTREFTTTIGMPPTRYAAVPRPERLQAAGCLGGFGGFGGGDGAQVERRAAAGGVEGAPDVRDDLGGRRADLLGREPEDDHLVGGHPAPASERAGVILRRGMPFA
jgi:AraC-like DNA-binding protein